jgi:flagellar M-ring protein FliF
MPTDDRLSFTAALSWLRVQVDRLRRSVMARRPAVRWAAAVLLVIGLSASFYWAATSLTPLSVRYLVSGRRFSSDDLIAVCRALDKQRVAYRVDDQRRVEVSTDQYELAADALAKLDLGPRSLNEIRDESVISSWLDTTEDRERRRQLLREKTIERLIGQLDGVVWSLVSINRPPARKWPRTAAKPTAFVYIETEDQRRLPYQTFQSIPAILSGFEEELTPGSITVMDTRGNKYFESGNIAVGVDSHNRAREEEMVDKIERNLEWIKGVRVLVRVPGPRLPAPSAAVPIAAAGKAGASSPVPPPVPNGGSAIFLNQPADALEAESVLRVPVVAAPESVTATAVKEPAVGALPEPLKPQSEPGRILIYVPRSYYLNADIRATDREPTQGELIAFKERTENQIRKTISVALSSSESWKVDIFMFPDGGSLSRPVAVPSPVDARRRALDWGIVGTVVAAVSILAAAGSWIRAARRPVVLPESPVSTRRYHVDTATEPGPSERVRELVRRNPEAAASVLQRWTGQGGRSR